MHPIQIVLWLIAAAGMITFMVRLPIWTSGPGMAHLRRKVNTSLRLLVLLGFGYAAVYAAGPENSLGRLVPALVSTALAGLFLAYMMYYNKYAADD